MASSTSIHAELVKLTEYLNEVVNELRDNKLNKHETTSHLGVEKTIAPPSNYSITVNNGGGRPVSYTAQDFYQLMYDQGKVNKEGIAAVQENIIGINENISNINQDIFNIKKTLDNNIKTVSQDISNINTSLPERFGKKIEKFNTGGEAILKIITILTYVGGIIFFIVEFIIKNNK